jgi:hypothetical protein
MIMIRKSEMYKKAKFYKICSFLFAVAMLVTMGAQRTIQVQAAPPQAAPQNFNNHACSDLIIGVPGEEFPPNINDNAGALHVVWSNSDHSGFHASGAQLWYQGASTDGASILDSMESGDQFARSLAAGDFNHDGYYDVAVGVPYEDVMVGGSGATDAGAVNVLYASVTGFSAGVNQFWTQESTDVPGVGEDYDYFGSALAAGDFNGDGYADLAVGAPGEDVSGQVDAGYVDVLFGSPTLLKAKMFFGGTLAVSQDSDGFADAAEAGDRFGAALAAGDFDGDGFDDLAIGSPEEDVSGANGAGMVHVLYGTALGYTPQETQDFYQDNLTSGIVEAGDYFGNAFAVGDFNRDGYDDLAIGSRGEDVSTINQAGVVGILYGSASGLTTSGSILFQQSWLFSGETEEYDLFGTALAAGDFDGDGYDDLAVSAVGEDVNGINGSGSVTIVYGGSGGLAAAGAQLITQVSLGISNEADDHMGASLAVGDFNCDMKDDLAIGMPDEDIGAFTDAGMILELHGSASGLVYRTYWWQSLLGETNELGDQFGFAMISAPMPWQSIFAPLIRK